MHPPESPLTTPLLSSDAPPPNELASGANLNPRVLAHLGDAVYELMVREWVIFQLGDVQADKIHRASITLACAEFQVQLLEALMPQLNPTELALMKRARNASISISRRNKQKLYRDATAFEALVGYWHIQQNIEMLQNLKLSMECLSGTNSIS
jgi:ribonuclease III family protein